jgi:hypothetical protein
MLAARRRGGALRTLQTLRILRAALAALAVAWVLDPAASAAEPTPPIEVFAPSPCLACIDWADHLRGAGFTVRYTEVPDIAAVKRRLKVPAELESLQSATVGTYFVEGPVPAEDIAELLRDRPRARGIAVPGLPRGAPGRELSNPTCETACTMLDNASGARDVRREMFNTLLVLPDGSTKVWARH